jgi:hypothetical protein
MSAPRTSPEMSQVRRHNVRRLMDDAKSERSVYLAHLFRLLCSGLARMPASLASSFEHVIGAIRPVLHGPRRH